MQPDAGFPSYFPDPADAVVAGYRMNVLVALFYDADTTGKTLASIITYMKREGYAPYEISRAFSVFVRQD